MGALCAWCLLAALWPHAEPGADVHLRAFGYAAAAALFVTAGAIQLARARLGADPLLRWSGAALLVLGGGILLAGVLGSLAALTPGGRPAPLTRLLIVAPALVLLLAGTGRNAARHGGTALRIAAALMIGHLGAGLLLGDPRIATRVARERLDALWLAEVVLASAAWTLAALRLAARARRAPGPQPRFYGWRALALALMAASEILYSLGLAGAQLAGTTAAGFVLVAAAIMLVVSGAGLREAFAASSLRTLALADELRATRERLHAVQELQRERLHDARTAVVGVLGATSLYAIPSADPAQCDDLQRIVAAEMRRLTSLLDPDTEEQPVVFDVREVFEPVLLARRALGMRVSAELGELYAFGRPTVTATVVANLLANAAKHAPGAAVTVRAQAVGGALQICVEDDGPGIPAEERELVLRRGWRSPAARTPGRGLGLYSSAQAMTAQGGSLRVANRQDGRPGTRIVLDIPAARDAQPAASLTARAS